MATIETKDVWDTTKVAEFLGVTKDTVKKYCQNGALDAFKMGRSWFVEKAEAKRYKKENLGKQGRPPKE